MLRFVLVSPLALLVTLLVFLLMSKLVDINPNTKALEAMTYSTISIIDIENQGSAIEPASLLDTKQAQVVTKEIVGPVPIDVNPSESTKQAKSTKLNKLVDTKPLSNKTSAESKDAIQQASTSAIVASKESSDISPIAAEKSLENTDRSIASKQSNRVSANATQNDSNSGLETPSSPTNVNQQAKVQAIALSRVEPIYPRNARRRKIEGYVLLSFNISDQGTTEDIRILDSSPKKTFDKAALSAVRQWRYKANSSNQSVPTQQVKLAFKLR